MSDLEELLERASKAAAALGSAVSSGKLITIAAHNDVDGICSGTIALLAVRGQGGSVHLSFSGHLYEDELAELISERPEFLLLCDMGSDQIPILKKSRIPYLVIDHHATEARDECLLNPYEFGLDGAREISASGGA
jgi:RecJ-like exonuclease